MAFETKNYGYPDELFLVRYADQSEKIILGKNFNDKISQNPNLVYEKLFSTYIENEKQSITLEKNLLNYTNLAVANNKEKVNMNIEELLNINTNAITPLLDTAIVYAFMENKPAPAYDPFTDSSYTQLTDTELYELTFYVYDHLGNTRVTYEPKFENGKAA